MRFKIMTGFAALAIGAALASTSAFAQNAGRNPNDGGLAQQGDYYQPQKSTQKPSRAPSENFKQGDYYAPESTPHVGRPMNDGGSQ
jgi:hypothetical protein